jgi:hypothetical protein
MIKRPVRAVIGAIDAAAARWSDACFEPRMRARDAVAARTGYALAMVEYALDRLFGDIRRDAIEAVICDELGSVDALDGFSQRRGRPRARALALGRICIVSSRTTIGVAITPALFALCAKCEVVVKDRDDHLVAAFFETLAEELPEFRAAATAQTWHGEEDAALLQGFDAVVAFGSDVTLAGIAASLTPPVRFIGYGSKASAGYVARGALSDERAAREIVAGAARDLALYESEGCLSLHALFVERGATVSPERFGELLVAAMRTSADEFPVEAASAATGARLAIAREMAAFRRGDQVHSDPAGAYLAILDPPLEEPPLFLPRAIGIHSVEHPAQAARYFERHGITLEALAVAGPCPDLLELAVRAGAARVVPFGTLQAPPLGAFHGGRPRIAEFVRWIGDET